MFSFSFFQSSFLDIGALSTDLIDYTRLNLYPTFEIFFDLYAVRQQQQELRVPFHLFRLLTTTIVERVKRAKKKGGHMRIRIYIYIYIYIKSSHFDMYTSIYSSSPACTPTSDTTPTNC